MWAPRVLDLARLRSVPGLEGLENRAWTGVSPDIHPSLTHLSNVMEPAIEQVAERVYSAVGFDCANATFVVGDDGIVVIDAMTAIENMRDALTAFRQISDLPVKGIVEVGRLSDPALQLLVEARLDAGVRWLKSGSGFGPPVTPQQIRRLGELARGRAGVKASGGIGSLEQAYALVEAGATRLGTSRGVTLMQALRRPQPSPDA